MKNHLFLDQHQFLYIGISFDIQLHRHHAAQLCIGLERPFQLIDSDGACSTYRAAIIHANTEHRLAAPNTPIVSLYLDIQSKTYQSILLGYPKDDSKPFQSINISQSLIAEFLDYYLPTKSEQSGKELINKLIIDLTTKVSKNTHLDPRISSVLEQLNACTDSQIPLDRLAKSVQLSPSRLTHLFKQEVGTPIRRYSLWSRVIIAMSYGISHQSLTAGAHYAGFSDSAHFSRVFKEMFGISPSAIVSKKIPIEVHFNRSL